MGKKGLRILAISSESEDKVAPFILQKGITYPVGLTDAYREGYGGGGIPHAYLIDPEGEVVWEGHPAGLSEGTIEKHLRKTTDFYLRDVAAELKGAAAAFKRGKLGEAEKLAAGVRDAADAEREAKADAEYVLRRVSGLRDFWSQTVEAGSRDGLYEEVFDALENLQKCFAGTDVAANAAAKEKELKADPAVKQELSLTKKLERYAEEFRDAGSHERKLASVQKKVEKFVEKHGDTKAGKRAQALLDAIRQTPRK